MKSVKRNSAKKRAQHVLELKLQYRNKSLSCFERKEGAQLEIMGQGVTERKAEKNQDNKVSETVTSLKHCSVPIPNVNTDAERMDKSVSNPHTTLNLGITSGYVPQEHKASDHTSLQFDKQVVVSHADTPVNTTAMCLPPKVLEFYAPNSGGCTSAAVQTPLTKDSESNMLTYSSTLKPTQPYPSSQGSEYVSQPTITPVGLVSDPQPNTASSCQYVLSPQQLLGYSSG